jgi:polyisoprenyl-phosphate glycosyltransferase
MLSVVVPCYRDAENIQELYDRLKLVLNKISPDHEIIYINDASPDNSQPILENLAKNDSKLTVIRHSRNFGLMNVYTLGMKQAVGDAVVLMDGDLQDPPEMIEKFFEKWREGYLVVYGVHRERDESAFKKFCFRSFYKVWNALADISIPLDAGDFSLMDRKVVDLLNVMPEKDRFIRGLRAWIGFPQIGVEFKRAARFKGQSTQSFLKYLSWALFAITSFSTAPLRFVSLVALGTTFISVFYLVILLAMYFVGVRGPQGFMTLIGVVLLLASVLFICLSIISEYVLRIYKEVKQRPTSVPHEIVNDHR